MKRYIYIFMVILLPACLPTSSTGPSETVMTQTQTIQTDKYDSITPTFTTIPSSTYTQEPTKTQKPNIESNINTSTPESISLTDEVRISPWDNEVTISTDQTAWVQFGSATCTLELANDWVRNLEVQIILSHDGHVIQEITPLESGDYWSEPVKSDQNIEICYWPSLNTWKSTWKSENLILNNPGEYQLHTKIVLTEPLIDGFDKESDGELDWYDAGVRHENTITIYVIEKNNAEQ